MDLEALLPAQMEELRRRKLRENEKNGESTVIKNCKDTEGILLEEKSCEEGNSEKIYSVLDYYPQSIEEIMEKLKSDYQMDMKKEEIIGQMMMMCLFGTIKQDSAGWFSRK